MNEYEIKIGNNIYKIPTTLIDLPVDLGKKIHSLLSSEIPDSVKEKQVLQLASGCTSEDLNTLSEKDINVLFCGIKKAFNRVLLPVFRIIKKGKKYYGLRMFKDLTVEDFIYMDYCFRSSNNPLDVAPMLMVLLYRKTPKRLMYRLKSAKIGLGFKSILLIKNYKLSKEESKEDEFKNMGCDYLLSIYQYVVSWRMELSEKYPIIFENGEQGGNGATENDQKLVFNKRKSMASRWGWYDVINSVCSSKADIDLWSKKPIDEFMVYVSYMIQKRREEQQKQ